MKKILLVMTMMMVSACCAAGVGDKEQVQAAFAEWRTALSSGNPESIVALYEADAVLLATLADKPITNQEERLKYFTTLTAKPELSATVNEEFVRMLDADNAVISGIYTFRFKQKGRVVAVPARFTFVYEYQDGRWMIVEHHSSKLPGMK